LSNTITVHHPAVRTAALLYSVFKLRIGFSIMLCTLAGAAITPGPGPGAWNLLLLAFAVLASSAAAGAFNQLVERDLDGRMQRTKDRPFVTGEFHPGWHWLAAIAVLLTGSAALAIHAANLVSAAYVFLGAFTYGVVYTVWLKRRSVWNIVVGGLAGSFAVLAGAAAVDPTPTGAPVLLALVLFLWTPPHFWSLAFAARDDYRRAGVPMLPCTVSARTAAWVVLAHTATLVLIAPFGFLLGLGWIYLTAAVAGGALFLTASIRFVLRPDRKRAMANFFASLAQLTLLLVGAMLEGWFAGGASGW